MPAPKPTPRGLQDVAIEYGRNLLLSTRLGSTTQFSVELSDTELDGMDEHHDGMEEMMHCEDMGDHEHM